jgi:hypothetical protein
MNEIGPSGMKRGRPAGSTPIRRRGEQPICSLAPPGDVDYAFAVFICERFDCVFHANGSISHYLRVLGCREFCRFSFLKCVGTVAHLIRSLLLGRPGHEAGRRLIAI